MLSVQVLLIWAISKCLSDVLLCTDGVICYSTSDMTVTALEILVDIANAQGEAVHAHAKVMQKGGNGLEVSFIPEASEATDK